MQCTYIYINHVIYRVVIPRVPSVTSTLLSAMFQLTLSGLDLSTERVSVTRVTQPSFGCWALYPGGRPVRGRPLRSTRQHIARDMCPSLNNIPRDIQICFNVQKITMISI